MNLKKLDKTKIVIEIASHLQNLNELEKNINFRSVNRNSPFNNYNLKRRDLASLLLLFAELDALFPNEKWDLIVHNYVLKIIADIEKNGIDNISLHSGLAGICFSIQLASRNKTRYQKLLSTLNSILLKTVEKSYLLPLSEYFQKRVPVPAVLYDLISGIVGIGIYGLQNLSDPDFQYFIEKVVTLLVTINEPIKVDEKSIPGWFIPSENQLTFRDKLNFPNGNYNVGLAHGIPGVLAFLSKVYIAGITVKGLKEAIEHISIWIQKQRRAHNNGGFFWEAMIPHQKASLKKAIPCKDAWCYGTPGVARSLFLAAKATSNEKAQLFALKSFRSIFIRSKEEWKLLGPTFCHGISGFLLITYKMFLDTKDKYLKDQVKRLEKMLLSFYHSSNPFGFKHFDLQDNGDCIQSNKVGFLDGSSGILLTLLSLTHKIDRWHEPLLIDL